MRIPIHLSQALHAAWQRKGALSALLWPFSLPVIGAVAYKHRRYAQRPELVYHSRLPLVVVGNIFVGGTGKTPVVIALVQALQERGWRPGVISRGYGAKVGQHARSGQGVLSAAEFGDEPALIARSTLVPIAVHPSRVLALKKLQKSYPGINVVIADDGLQHLALGRDIEIVVQDARGTGNGRVLPAGPLREPDSRLESVDFLITNLQSGQIAPRPFATLAHQLSMRLVPERVVQLSTGLTLDWPAWLAQYGNKPVAAVAAIGQPERFFAMLRAAGLSLEQTIGLPDHDAYERSPFSALASEHIVITSKDAVKCEQFQDARLWVVHASPKFSDPDWLDLAEQMLRVIADKKAKMAAVGARH
ncbi:tetraacyldisaccharide 4'-kinase [Candidimonas sp. SYP-B2681]|uniref:tetraacyldisaccharide 4'-kinase n=1 Tax=Candidimonas sp. SYP-B2681 TaxID=2497686 RepID=UPI000F89159C|nr:tetraacyldisaccharide 4'-kinase [Candidimonas sp. SYP-B2681]RTZ47723.1 tetraacyldisaccharide 4'-kinase [Candidimonas sp. SYP-B2681]